MGSTEREPQSDQCSRLSSSQAATHPILSSSVAAVLVLLYLPRILVVLLLSPVTLSALALLTVLLCYGADSPLPPGTTLLSAQPAPEKEAIDISFLESYLKLKVANQCPQNPNQPDHTEGRLKKGVSNSSLPHSAVKPEGDQGEGGVKDLSVSPTKMDTEKTQTNPEGAGHLQTTPFRHNFFDRCRGDPLEVIYEEYGEGEDGTLEVEMEEFQVDSTEQFKSPAQYEPSVDRVWRSETTKYARGRVCFTSSDDSSSDSEGDSPLVAWLELPDYQCLQLEVEDPDEEGMIEIPVEEDNLIELDLSVFR